MTKFEELQQNMSRLENHLDNISGGSLVARDDIASVLHIMTSPNRGYNLIRKALTEQGLPDLNLIAYQHDLIERSRDGNSKILAVRSINSDNSTRKPLDEVLDQEAVFHDNSLWTSSSSLSWRQVITYSRNQHGSHVDDNPVAWLEDLRIFPIANADVMTFLLWSFGEALLDALTHHLTANGVEVTLYERRKALNGIEIQEPHILSIPPTSIIVGADLYVRDEHTGQRTIFGGVYNSIPFILGLNSARNIIVTRGNANDSIEDLESNFLLGPAGDGLNRAQRRAMRENVTR